MRINDSSGFKFNIFDMKQTVAEEENSTHQQVIHKENQGHSYSPRNMMADNFLQLEREESRYINGLMTSYAVADHFRSQMQSVVDIYQAEANIVSAASPANNAELLLVGMKAERAAKEEAENYAGKKMEEKLEQDRKEEEIEQEQQAEEKIEEKLMPEGTKQVLDADPDPEALTEEIAEKIEEATEARGDKVLKGNELEEGQTVAANVQAAEQLSSVVSASVVPKADTEVELTGNMTQTVEGESSSVGAVPPPGTYVDKVV